MFFCVFGCVHMCTCMSKQVHAHSCAGPHGCQELPTLGFICFFPWYTISHWNPQGLHIQLGHWPGSLGGPPVCFPSPGIADMPHHAQLSVPTVINYSTMYHALLVHQLGEHLVYSLFWLMCYLWAAFLFVCLECVCAWEWSHWFLGSFWGAVWQWLYQFIFALSDFIVVFLRQVFTLLPKLPWDSQCSSGWPSTDSSSASVFQCWDHKCDQCWTSLILLHLC